MSARVGRDLAVLFEEPAGHGRWMGHAENHVLVEAAAPDGRYLGNVIATVRVDAVEAGGDRVRGTLVEAHHGG